MHCRILTRKKFLILLIVLIGALSLLSGCGGIIPPPIVNETAYRALCVGVGDYMYFPDSYGNIDLPGPPYDVNRICYTLGLTRRRQKDMKTALDITDSFRKINSMDPVKYDFTLAQLGMRNKGILSRFLSADKGTDA